MKPLLVLVGLSVLVGGGIAIASAMSGNKPVKMVRGAAYSFVLHDEGDIHQDDLAAMGFASMTFQALDPSDPNGLYRVQAIWVGTEGAEFTLPNEMSEFTYLGYPNNSRSAHTTNITRLAPAYNPQVVNYIPGQVNFNT